MVVCMEKAFDINLLKNTIDKTGFPMEFEVQKILEKHGWRVENNKFYIDDVMHIEREIDLLATKEIMNKDVYYAVKLIISCKKSKNGYWVFLTSNHNDNVSDIRYTTNIRHLDYAFSHNLSNVSKLYGENIKKMLSINSNVRNTLQVNKDSYKDESNKHIYDSIITTIKAENYEIFYRNKSNKNNKQYCVCYYLLSIFDGQMIENNLDNNTCEEVDEIKYVNQHIIDEEERLYRVHFIKKDALDKILDFYDCVFNETINLFTEVENAFFTNIFDKDNVLNANVYWNSFCNDLLNEIDNEEEYYDSDLEMIEDGDILLTYCYSGSKLHIKMYMNYISLKEARNIVNNFNDSSYIKKKTKRLLLKYFKYDGKFVYELDQRVEDEHENEFSGFCF